MAYGDHIYVTRPGYTHHGIDCGDGTVIHYDGGLWEQENAEIKHTSLEVFAHGQDIQVMKYGRCFPPAVVIRRAQDRLGENNYDLFDNNCEHFARWCKTGEAKSAQVEISKNVVQGLTHSVAAIAAGMRLVGTGAMRSGMALTAIPTLATQHTLEQVLQDDDSLSEEERQARAAGRTMTQVGAVASSLGTLATISASGSVAGLSTAGIEAGLSAIGASVGGGVVTGTFLAAAVPALVTLVAGYGSYHLWKR